MERGTPPHNTQHTMLKTIITTVAIAATTVVAAAPAHAGLEAFGIGGSFMNEAMGASSVNRAFGLPAYDQNFTRAAQVCRNNGYAQVRTVGTGRYQCFTGINSSSVWTF